MNPEYYIIYQDDVASGPYSTADEARRNIEPWQLKRGGRVTIARTIAVSETKAAYTVSWTKPYDLGEQSSTDALPNSVVLED